MLGAARGSSHLASGWFGCGPCPQKMVWICVPVQGDVLRRAPDRHCEPCQFPVLRGSPKHPCELLLNGNSLVAVAPIPAEWAKQKQPMARQMMVKQHLLEAACRWGDHTSNTREDPQAKSRWGQRTTYLPLREKSSFVCFRVVHTLKHVQKTHVSNDSLALRVRVFNTKKMCVPM